MKRAVSAGMVAILLSGCAVKNQVSHSLQAIPLTAFQQSESNPNQRIYKEPGVDLRQYQQVLLDPLQFIRQENGQWYLLTANEQNEIGRYYHATFQRELLNHGVRIATAPGPGVLRVQAAITNFDLTRPDPKLRDLLPAKIAINVTREVIGKEPYLLRVGSMAQLLDSQSGKLLVRVMDARESPDTTHKESPISAGEMAKMIDQWAAARASQLADNLGR
ncbi:DUF3313 domain-containing protein [Aeromonas dhakensis]|uniref:DUF3313 domain-containing protein n=1 Tax=Aeromonas dhakensis TaxID=196024 RepID=UPI0021575150|nr:DUF3313 domain-containing protein [Aeromonas dhakensis]MCR6741634.1 DUF3313 domain-containing protein [Aeromonas dhakensis]HDZ8880823.1 DUF3313 domain-containing protein [Aeromonas dhakensis]